MHRLLYEHNSGGEDYTMELKVIVANTGEDSIGIIDLKNNYITEQIPIKSLIKEDNNLNIYLDTYHIGPYALCLSSNKEKIYLSNIYDNSIYKIDISTMKIEDLIPVGKFPVCVEVYEELIYVLCSDSNSISIIDENSFKLIGNIALGEKPGDIEIDRLSQKIYIANSNGYSIDVIDLKKDSINSIKLNKNPIKIQIEKDLMYILSNINNGVLNCSNISVMKLTDNTIIKSIDMNGIYNNMIKPFGKELLYITSFENGYIFKMDLYTGNIIIKRFIDGMPNKIIYFENNKLLISNISKDCVTIFDTIGDKVVTNIKVGNEPNGLILI
ncbi:YncE family protein [Anaerosalibacter sp. Marseille-P3206]|uniref:YncE family protein n=1 Tax=Anaerosalibacter sp. Marseille-P3206 TaxID=1871005 RepID=UPI001356347A|nr:YncE family protein [Anaerosalibacter sp. Marseille-P3206]